MPFFWNREIKIDPVLVCIWCLLAQSVDRPNQHTLTLTDSLQTVIQIGHNFARRAKVKQTKLFVHLVD